jgi:hypothetical protein
MADQAEQVSPTGLVDTKQQPGQTKRREYSETLKCQMVAERLVPGVSVSIVRPIPGGVLIGPRDIAKLL